MGKVRIHELAKKLNMTNQELMTKLTARGMEIRSHSSTIDEMAAMKALSVGAAADAAGAAKRTVLRRRRPEEAVAEEVAIVEEIETAPVVATIDETPELQAVTEVQEVVELAPVAPLALPPPVPAVAPKAPGMVILPPGSTPPAHHNVVRVIDAGAIRARLAAEGRTFKPRGPVIRPAGGGASSGPRPFTGVREIRVSPGGFGAPTQMVDVTSGAKPAGARAAKKKGKDDYVSDKDRKEQKGGGYELWLQPGKKRRSMGKKGGKGTTITQAAAHKRIVELSGPITVNDLAHRMSVKAGQLVTKLMSMGMMVTVNQPIDPDTAAIVAGEFEFEVKNVAFEETNVLNEVQDTDESLLPRPPVVTVMGHVDHGKTSILDALRQADVASSEAGGITQHIGAYTVTTERGPVTFLDTPGHEAFTEMRARGAQVTDIVILVVAADDGVMPQTIEAIDHAKAAKVPIVVAVNKIDAPNAKPERVLQQLTEHGIVSEEWGGDVQVFKVSALKKIGLKELLEGLIDQAEMMELKANPAKQGTGSVIEAKLDKGRGPVSTVLTQSGTLRLGDHIVAGEHTGRVRAMHDSNGKPLTEAGPSMAVQILGLSGVPMAGDKFNAVTDDKQARTIADHRAQKLRELELMKSSRVTLENFLQSSPKDKGYELRLIVKADVFGSVEALVAALKGLSTKQVTVDVVHSGVGTITENDVNLALASKAIIIGFNTKPDGKAHTLASQEKVDIRSYSVIYAMLDEVKLAMAGLLAPVIEENYIGRAEVRQVFPVTKLGKIAGCYITDGKITRSAKIRVKRGNDVLHEGGIVSLRRFKDDVREVTMGYECGLALEGFDALEEGDLLECFETKHVAAKLDESLKDEAKRLKHSIPVESYVD